MNRRTRTVYLVPYVLWILLFVVAPILLIVYYSFFDVDGNFTVDNYIHFFHPCLFKNDGEFVLVCVFNYGFHTADFVPNGLLVNETKA